MCGIAGVLGRKANGDRAARMRARQRHRGPDEVGAFTEDSVALGHTRLSVLDPSSAGRQPMRSADGRHVLLYNGEVYNFRELRGTLRDRGHAFRSETDSEVVLHAWSEWGRDSVERLEGMYAFAVWDRRERALHLVRDRIGIKPLYWYRDGEGGTIAFASEVRTLLASGVVPRSLDSSVLPAFLSQQTVPTPGTLVAGVRMLAPGSVLRVKVESGRITAPDISRYWDPAERALERSEEIAGLDRQEALQGLRERLESAVARRLMADVPLGAFLSGGVDSTAVVGLMTRASDTPVRTFTVAFDEEGYNDGPYARLAAERLGTDHTEIRLRDDELVASVPRAVEAQDHPSGDGVNTWIVSRAAKQAGLTVALSGLGGDELFGGYPTFGRLAALAQGYAVLQRLPELLRAGAGRFLRRIRPGVATDKIAALLSTDGSVPEAYPILRQVFTLRRASSLLVHDASGGDPPGQEARDPYTAVLRDAFGETGASLSPLQRASLAELTCYMQDVLLRDTDQMSMAHSLEVRVPFLDRELVEYALSLPDEARQPVTPPKRYLVRATEDVLPGPVASREKSGFAMPFDRWMRGPLRAFCEDGIGAAACHPAFRETRLRELWRDFLAENPRIPWSRPWLLVVLGYWLERERIRGVA